MPSRAHLSPASACCAVRLAVRAEARPGHVDPQAGTEQDPDATRNACPATGPAPSRQPVDTARRPPGSRRRARGRRGGWDRTSARVCWAIAPRTIAVAAVIAHPRAGGRRRGPGPEAVSTRCARQSTPAVPARSWQRPAGRAPGRCEKTSPKTPDWRGSTSSSASAPAGAGRSRARRGATRSASAPATTCSDSVPKAHEEHQAGADGGGSGRRRPRAPTAATATRRPGERRHAAARAATEEHGTRLLRRVLLLRLGRHVGGLSCGRVGGRCS